MKYLIAVILTAAISLSVAFAKGEGEILFRDIPWGITLDEYVGRLEDEGMQITLVLPSETGCTVNLGNSNLEPVCKVAGYDAFMINVNSVYDVNDGDIDSDPLNSLVYSASYTLIPNEDDVISDLRKKLSVLYGEETILNQHCSFESYLWNGRNNTTVELKPGLTQIVYTDNSVKAKVEEIEVFLYRNSTNLEGL